MKNFDEALQVFFFFCRLNFIYPGSWKLQVILMERPQPLETVCLAHTTCWSMISGKVSCIPVDTYMINILLSSFSGAERCYLSALIYVLNYRYTWSNKVKTESGLIKSCLQHVPKERQSCQRKAKGCVQLPSRGLKFWQKQGLHWKWSKNAASFKKSHFWYFANVNIENHIPDLQWFPSSVKPRIK